MGLESKKYPQAEERGYALATLAVHADDHCPEYPDVSPAIHTATTYKYSSDPSQLKAANERTSEELVSLPHCPTTPPSSPTRLVLTRTQPNSHIYSRFSIENTSRLETLLSPILNGHVITYSSGLSAFHALLVHTNPKTLAIGQAYHGNHDVASIFSRLTGLRTVGIHGEAAFEGVEGGDLVHLETPINPTGEALSIRRFAEEAHRRGALLSVDSTFAPPPLQDAFAQGADIVLHSGTKYIGGHSDLLCGILVVKDAETADRLRWERGILGCVMGNLEGWLGIRSMRTLALRVERASKNAEALVRWLDEEVKKGGAVGKVVERVRHASVQEDGAEEGGWLREQMPNGFGPVFVIMVTFPSLSLSSTFPNKNLDP